MLKAKELEGKEYIDRKGKVSRVVLPKESSETHSLRINIKEREMYFEDGLETYLIEKEIGVAEKTVLAVSKAGEYMVLEVVEGCVYRKSADGSIEGLRPGGATFPAVNPEEIKWQTTENITEYMEIIIQGRYNIPNKTKTRQYVDNLTFLIEMQNSKIIKRIDKGKPTERLEEIPTYSIKVMECYDDLGLNEFEYRVYQEDKNLGVLGLYRDDDFEEKEREREIREREEEQKLERKYRQRRGEDDDNEQCLETDIVRAGFSIGHLKEESEEELEEY